MKSTKGFTLIEMAVVLAIIAILAAMLTPLLTNYIDNARNVRATADTSSLAKAYLLHYRDTSFFPVYSSGAQSTGVPSKNCQVSGSAGTPALPTGTNHANWAGGMNCVAGTIGLIRSFLNVNTLGLSTSASNSNSAYRGPYLDGLDGSDPWGQPYVVTSKHLGSNQTYYAFTISAGPDLGLGTDPLQVHSSVLATTGDDITTLIR